MNYWEAMSNALCDIAHSEGERGVKTIWTDLRELTDCYSFQCRRCQKNGYFKKIEDALRWYARSDARKDECDLWASCSWYTEQVEHCDKCSFKIED